MTTPAVTIPQTSSSTAMWIALIAQVGLPIAYQLWKDWQNKNEPTQADWDALFKLSQKTTAEYVAEAQAAAAAAAATTPAAPIASAAPLPGPHVAAPSTP